MEQWRFISPLTIAVLVAIGCGGGPPADAAKEKRAGKPQDASATTQSERESAKPVRLAQATEGSAASGGGASIHGIVHFEGTAPARGKVQMSADPVCQQQHADAMLSEEVVVNADGTLKNVAVYVTEGLSGAHAAPTTPVTLDQAGCWYQPHVFGIQANQPLEIVNSDATLHNVNAKPTANPPFNIAQPVKGMKMTKKFTKPEVGVKFKCNVHPWMSAYAVVLDHPFFSVTDASGAFTISGVPAGTYTIEAWHESYGTQTQQVTVSDGGAPASADFTFSAN